jgi:hypothetical protein
VNIKKAAVYLQNWLATFDWKLLVFLLLFLNVKLVIKVAAIIAIYIWRCNFKFGFAAKNSRLPVFYLIVIALALLNWLTSGLLTNANYFLALFTGISFWLLCILAVHQVKLTVEKNDPAVVHKTILLFFIINAFASLAVYGSLVWETGAVNVYKYQGNFQKYFIGTGDYIKGITLDTSTTNAVINAFAVVYFLLRHKYKWALLCMAVLLLTGSNITNVFLCLTLLYIFLFRSTKNQKSIITVCLFLLVIFWVKVSPQNNKYVTAAYENIFLNPASPKMAMVKDIPITLKPDSILTPGQRKQKFAQRFLDSMYVVRITAKSNTVTVAAVAANQKQKPVIPQPDIHSTSFQHKDDTSALQLKLVEFVKTDSLQKVITAISPVKTPGKIIALLQTFNYFKQHPFKIITGAGMGMFSSKLAFKISALKIAGSYPEKYAFINSDFKKNNLALYLNYFTKSAGQHSLINTPNSTYNQVLSEYGVAGFFSLVLFYLGFFFKRIKKISYGIPVLLLMSGFFFAEYWFEQLSVVVLFELLLFVDIKDLRRGEQPE